MNPILFLFGGDKIIARPHEKLWVLNCCYRYGISAKGLHKTEDGGLILFCRRKEAKFLQAEAITKTGRRLEQETVGLPSKLVRYRKRYGLMFGLLFGAFLLFFSSRFVWNVRVRGNQWLTDSELQRLFAECGLSVGDRISKIDAPALENRILLNTDRLSWVSVTVEGTVADVQVIEAVDPPEKEPLRPANLIASTDGEIVHFELYRGTPTVKVGQMVRSGDLLVSGIYESPTAGVLLMRASGSVLAKTVREWTVEIPLLRPEKTVQKRKIAEISFTFFGKKGIIFKRYGNQEDNCDIIKENIFRLSDFSYPVPLRLDVVWEVTCSEKENLISTEVAEQLATAELETQLSSLSRDTEILEKSISVDSDEKTYRLNCKIHCIENIAKQTEFEIE